MIFTFVFLRPLGADLETQKPGRITGEFEIKGYTVQGIIQRIIQRKRTGGRIA